MTSAEEYRQFAAECSQWASAAKSDRERSIFRQMRLTWLNVARIVEEGRPLQTLEDLTTLFPVDAGAENEGLSGLDNGLGSCPAVAQERGS